MLVGAGTAAWLAVLTEHGYLTRANIVVSVMALTVLAAGLALSLAVTVPVAIALLGTEYVAILGFETDVLDTRAPLVAGALLAVAELAYWSLEQRTAVGEEAGLQLRRALSVLATTFGSAALAAILLAATSVPLGGSVTWDAFGLAAAAGAVAVLARLSSR